MKGLSGLKSVVLVGVVLMIMGSFLLSSEVYAREVLELEEIVVTATRVERLIGSLAASVSVITREEIEETQAKTVDDLLKRVAGVRVRRHRGLTTREEGIEITMRGTGQGARTLILMDGVPLNTRFTGGVRLLNAMAVQDIERIEIVRGASSVVYGSNAMGGVINIITRRPEVGFSGDMSFEGGTFDTYIGNIGLRYGAERFAVRLGAEHKQARGYEWRDEQSQRPWDPLYQLAEMQFDQISLGADLHLGESLLGFSVGSFREDMITGSRHEWDILSESMRYKVSLEAPIWAWGGANLSLKGFYFDNDYLLRGYMLNRETEKFDLFREDTKRRNPDYGVMTQIAFDLDGHYLTAGADFRGGSIESNQMLGVIRRGRERGRFRRKVEGAQGLYGVFVNNEIHLGDRVILSAGLRYDWWENREGRFYDENLGRWLEFPNTTDSALSPGGGIAYQLTERVRLRASLGTGFSAPSLKRMFISGPHDRHYTLGNPDLKAERLDWSYDVGVDIQPNENLLLRFTFYQSRLSDFMAEETLAADDPRLPDWLDSGGLPVERWTNVGEVDVHGIEAEMEVSFNEQWSAFANHTFNVSKVGEDKLNPEWVGNYLPFIPRNRSTIGITYDNPQLFTLSLDIGNQGSRFIRLDNSPESERDGFTLVNMRISRKLFDDMEIFANVENLTDERIFIQRRNLSPPFNMLIGARHTF